QNQGQVAEARTLYDESQRLFAQHAAADPEDFETRFRLYHVLSRWGRLERDELNFDRAGELFQRALDERQRLDPDVADGTSGPKSQDIALLRAEIAACELAPRALADLKFALSRPAAEACLLLSIRARAMLAAKREDEVLAAADSL